MDAISRLNLQQRLLQILIKTGRYPSVVGLVGRLCGRYIGWRLILGPRIIIDNPQEFIQSKLLNYGIYEPEVAAVLLTALEPSDLFFDIGANIGVHTLVAASQKAYTHAFEPVPRLARRLRQNIRLNRFDSLVSVFEVALSKSEGQATLYIAARKDDGSHSLIEGVPATSIKAIPVTTTTIDLHVKMSGCGVPSLIKIDVEGAEAWVLDGACDTLAQPNRPVIVLETGDRLANRVGESAKSVLQRLFNLEYRIFHLNADTMRMSEIRPDEVLGSVANYVAIPSESEKVKKILKEYPSVINSIANRCPLLSLCQQRIRFASRV